MTELKTFDFTGAMGRGLQLGQAIRQQQNQGKLAALLGQARTASGPQRDALMGQAYSVDPAAGMAAEQQFGKLDEIKAKRLGQMASIFTSVDPQQRAAMWPSIRQELSTMIPGAQYPEMWDESLLPQAQAIAQQLSSAGGDTPAQQQYAEWLLSQVPPEQRDQTLGVLAGYKPRPSSAAIGYKTVKGADGREYLVAVDPREVGAQTIGGGPSYGSGVQSPQGGASYGAQQGGAPTGGGDLLASVQSLVGPLGGRITSTTGGQHNPGSKHYGGGAVDIGMAQESPEQQERILATLQSNPALRVRDERQRPPGQQVWDGPHLHVEWAQQGGQPQVGANPFASRRPEDEEAAKETAKRSVGLQFAPAEAQADADRERLVQDARVQSEKAAQAGATYNSAQYSARQTRDFRQVAQELLNHEGLDRAVGFGGQLMSQVPGTPAADFAAKLDNLKNRAFIAALGAMRESSKTGGAVGNVSDAEGKRFENAFVALSQAQSPAQFRSELKRLIEITEESERNIQTAYQRDYGSIGGAPSWGGQSQAADSPQGNRIRIKF